MNCVLVFVVDFHNQFITKVDRAYNIRCFYAQTDKTVTTQLDVWLVTIFRLFLQLQPQGMNYVLEFVVNFHNQFTTKVDRAYNVRCFYPQTD